ncbi:MAG TPA: PLP-dependent aminotransferase family protein [Candidatus Avacidaminococcus intestinavium]|uniref:PLP-dependent aminotransferase family protein n=1 Tax=Candidatus Avacidaminococcus intestinavium TaxID=2840684 RepID=A0A9D1SL60_9FIRM|nr:PLP-dependent aminotransferase family protein [Candidatus Avacidaminococcus intestinavium]
MLDLDFTLTRQTTVPLYKQLAEHIKKEIRQQHLKSADKLPSIRKLAAVLNLSRTTVENTYNLLLTDGYIISQPQKGYLVVNLQETETPLIVPSFAPKIPEPPLYDFANNYIDIHTFNTALWRRCTNNTLKTPANIASYGEAQGESKLREALATYSYESRGVLAAPEQIVIGAGLQSLLAILLNTLPITNKKAAFEPPGFAKAELIFASAGWQVEQFTMQDLETQTLPPLLFISPTNPYKGTMLTANERIELLNWAKHTNGFIIEDDYNGEFRYFARPTGALQGLEGGDNVIYFGSFSRLLMPSLRISYMVLPSKLLPYYREKSLLFNQTSSTIEQLTLAEFIAAGHLGRHVRRLRKLYAQKNILLRQYLQEIFGERIEVTAYTSGLHIKLRIKTATSGKLLYQKALTIGVRIISLPQTPQMVFPEILLSFAGIKEEELKPALLLLRKAWFD